MALLIAFTFTFGLAAMTLATQTRDIAILATIGWSRREIGRWFVAESLVSSIPIALLAVLGWVLFGGEVTALAVGLGMAASSSIAVGTATLLAHRRARRSGADRGDTWTGLPTRGPARVSGVVGFGIRSWLARPARSIAAILGLAVGAAAFGVGALAIAESRQ